MCTTCRAPGRSLYSKQEFTPEEERVIRNFFDEIVQTISPVKEELVAGILAGRIALTDLASLRVEVRGIAGNYTNDVGLVISGHNAEGAQVGREVAARVFDLDVDYDIVPQRTLDALEQWSFRASDEVMANVGDEMAQYLHAVHSEGLSVPDAVSLFEDEYWDGRIEGWRSERIVRTEVLGSSNAGQHSSLVDAPSVVGEQWLATADDRTRDTHQAMNGMVVATETDFRLPGGARTPHPGHYSLPAGERVHCRCTAPPVFRDQLTDSQFATIQSGGQVRVAI